MLAITLDWTSIHARRKVVDIKNINTIMGIEHGANEIISLFERGLYSAKPARYIISVDGELLLYKGMTQDNLSRRSAEEHIAVDSYNYLINLCAKIEQMMEQQQQQQPHKRIEHKIVVYMDSVTERVMNKKIRTQQICSLDSRLMRNIFITMCERNGHIFVEQLGKGSESELQMYILRDKQCPLNIFITNDSDFISIAYNHQPIYTTSITLRDIKMRTVVDNSIIDQNFTYENCDKVTDSCLWIKCCSSKNTIRCYGLDLNTRLVGFSTTAFRLLVALCGTDFTTNILTSSMIRNIVSYVRQNVQSVEINRLVYAMCAKNPESGYSNESLLDRPIADNDATNGTLKLFRSLDTLATGTTDFECVMLCLFALGLGSESGMKKNRVILKRGGGSGSESVVAAAGSDNEKCLYAENVKHVYRQFKYYESYLRTGIMELDSASDTKPNAAFLNRIWLHILWLQYYSIERKFTLKLLRNCLNRDLNDLFSSVARKFLIEGCDRVFDKTYQSKLMFEASLKLSQNIKKQNIKSQS